MATYIIETTQEVRITRKYRVEAKNEKDASNKFGELSTSDAFETDEDPGIEYSEHPVKE